MKTRCLCNGRETAATLRVGSLHPMGAMGRDMQGMSAENEMCEVVQRFVSYGGGFSLFGGLVVWWLCLILFVWWFHVRGAGINHHTHTKQSEPQKMA